MLFGLWPTKQPTKLIRLFTGLLMSEFYLAAFVVCCVAADISSRVTNVPSAVRAGYGAAAFFSFLGWLSHGADVGLAWYLHGGIWPQAKQNS